MFPLPLLESMALRRGEEGRWEVGFVHVLHRRSLTPGVPGRKIVRVVVLDLGPWFATQLRFPPASVREGERSHDFQSQREVLRQGGIQSLGSCVTLRKLSCLDSHFFVGILMVHPRQVCAKHLPHTDLGCTDTC